MTTVDWDNVYQKINEILIKDGDHLVINKISNRECMTFNKYTHLITHWLYICREKMDPSVKLYMKKLCDRKKCVNLEHWVNMNKIEEYYKYVAQNLIKNSKQEGDCRLWTGYINVFGYGVTRFRTGLNFKKRSCCAHIISYMVSHNIPNIPENLLVRHKCKNKNCIAPNHLELGTAKENHDDMLRDGTASIGSKHPNATINETMAVEIYKSNDVPYRELAKKFNTTINAVKSIRCGKSWNHVTGHQKHKYNRKIVVIDEHTPEDFFVNLQKRIRENSKEIYDDITKETHWIWTLSIRKSGYGCCHIGHKNYGSHEASWIAFNKKQVPDGMIICHKCIKHRDCVNPDHLYLGTPKTNADDVIKNGTSMQHPSISKEIATQIMMSKGNGTCKDRASRFAISESIVKSIDRGITWKDLRIELDIPITNTQAHLNKISAETAENIIRSKGFGTIAERAKKFNTSVSIVRHIDCGEAWKKLREKLNVPINPTNNENSIYHDPNKPKIQLRLKESLPSSTIDETQKVLGDTPKIKIKNSQT